MRLKAALKKYEAKTQLRAKKIACVAEHVYMVSKYPTTLQSLMNAKVSQHKFWHCHENGLIKTIKMIPHNLYLNVKLTFLYCGLRLILVYPNPQ